MQCLPSKAETEMIKKVASVLLLCSVLGGCALFTPGPIDPVTGRAGPSIAEIVIKETGEKYDESPFKDFGPYGAGIAAVLAAALAAKKGIQVYKKRKADGQSAGSSGSDS